MIVCIYRSRSTSTILIHNAVADLYIVLYDYITSHPLDETPHGHEGYFFGENGEHRLYDIGKAIQVAFNELGVGQKDPKAEPDTFTDEENQKYFGVRFLRLILAFTSYTDRDTGNLPRLKLALPREQISLDRLETSQDYC